MPADHYLRDVTGFQRAVATAVEAASNGDLLTFGVVPTAAETGYGYIKARGQAHGEAHGREGTVMAVDRFVEKPHQEDAERYLASGEHFWNSGMFLFRAGAYLAELARLQPEMYRACEAAVAGAESDLDFTRPGQAFCNSPSNSIDYAVMERTDKAAVLPVDIGWSDVGSWSALGDVLTEDADGNISEGDVINVGTTNSLVHAHERLVATVGLDNVVVVETADAVLVADKESVQHVKSVVERIRECERTSTTSTRRSTDPGEATSRSRMVTAIR